MGQHFDYQTWRDFIDRIRNEGRNVSQWEMDFVNSLDEQLDRVGTLSEKQEDILNRVYTEKVP